IEPTDHGRVGEAVAASLEASLRRLQMERVDLFQLHNLIADGGRPGTVSARLVLEEVVPALLRLRRQGKIRFLGITALGDVAALSVEPIASGPDYRADVRRAQRLAALVEEGHAGSVIEAALRFAIGNHAVSTVLVGYSSLEQLEYAARCVEKGPLPPAALQRL